jgi:ABC-type molybdenum transport system ATPase subunit/photorepair protein PhrA
MLSPALFREPVGKHVKYPKMEKYMRKEKYVLESLTPDVEDNEFKPLIDKILDSNQSWLINGPPGAGKTTLINMIKEKLTEDNKVYNV